MGNLRRGTAVLAIAALAGCGSQTGDEPAARAGDPLVVTRYAVTVMDDADSGPEACLGAVAESFPPQCGGPPLPGWEWAEHAGDFETSGEVRWGEFALTGRWDGETLTVTEAVPAAEYDAPEPDNGLIGTPCPEPDGGWAVVDPATTNRQTMEGVMQEATRLEGYAQAWLDQSPNPAFDQSGGPMTLEEVELLNDPRKLIVNVAVVGDPAAAEARLRKTWGGALCVSKGRLTEKTRLEIQERVVEELPGFLGGLGGGGVRPLEVTVVHDDGSIQSWFDEEYGEGTVVVDSALRPAD